MSMKEIPVTYYKDELNDEFSTAVITPRAIDENYKYGGKGLLWNIAHLFWYRIVAFPIAFIWLKCHYHHKIINKKVIKPYLKNSFYLYANHTNPVADALIPSFVSHPKDCFVIVHANNVSMPYLGRINPYLGALPLPDNMAATKNFMDAIKYKMEHKHVVTIYPEAHIWPFYTKIRPFKDTSFRYPVQYDVPVFAFTNTYQKRKNSDVPDMITYVDGPFFADKNLAPKERRMGLRNKVYNAMVERSKNSNVELIKYVKVEEKND